MYFYLNLYSNKFLLNLLGHSYLGVLKSYMY